MNQMIRVEIKPELLSWARERAGYDPDALAHRFPKLTAWEPARNSPTRLTRLVYDLYELTDDEIAIVEGQPQG
jgi:hypothetical protein